MSASRFLPCAGFFRYILKADVIKLSISHEGHRGHEDIECSLMTVKLRDLRDLRGKNYLVCVTSAEI